MVVAAPLSSTSQLPTWATTTAPETLTFTQVEDLIRNAGGTLYEAVVGAAISLGVESSGQTQVLAGGVGPARGLFQFEPTTWAAYTPGPSSVAGASPLQQAQAFVKAVSSDLGFHPWAPDLGGHYGGPNANPTGPLAGSPVANYLSAHHVALPATNIPGGAPAKLAGWYTFMNPFNLVPSAAGAAATAAGSAAGAAASAAASPLLKWLTGPLEDILFALVGVILVVVGLVVIAHSHGNDVREAGGETLTQQGTKAVKDASEAGADAGEAGAVVAS